MSYYTISIMSADPDLRARVAACAAQEGVTDPENWAYRHSLVIAAQPGWSEAWESALADDAQPSAALIPSTPALGRRDDVITDGMVLSAVQKFKGGGRDAETA